MGNQVLPQQLRDNGRVTTITLEFTLIHKSKEIWQNELLEVTPPPYLKCKNFFHDFSSPPPYIIMTLNVSFVFLFRVQVETQYYPRTRK